jgi:hypothetical protein
MNSRLVIGVSGTTISGRHLRPRPGMASLTMTAKRNAILRQAL